MLLEGRRHKLHKETHLTKNMNTIQEQIKVFNDARDWSDPSCIKDLLLNMNEEIGEFWNVKNC